MKRMLSNIKQHLAELRIVTKLTLGFSIVLALTVVLGVYGIVYLAMVNRTSNELVIKWMPAVGYTTAARSAILEFRDYEGKTHPRQRRRLHG